MAKLVRGTTFSTGEGPTASMLNDHVDDALLYSVTSACSASGTNLATIQGGASPPAGADGDPYVTTAGELKFHDGVDYESVVSSHIARTITLQNSSGQNMTAGDVVILDSAQDMGCCLSTSTVDCSKVIGVLKQNLVDTEWGEVYVRGICEVKIDTAFSTPARAPPGSLIACASASGMANSDASRSAVDAEGRFFGLTLGTVTGEGVGGSSALITCYVWK